MIYHRSLLLLFFINIFILSCRQVSKDTSSSIEEISKTDFNNFSDFWVTFQSAVIQEESEVVAAMTRFPLGSNGFFELSQADKTTFLQKYKDLFDAHAIAKIKSTKAEAVDYYMIGENEVKQAIYKNADIKRGTKVYQLPVLYI